MKRILSLLTIVVTLFWGVSPLYSQVATVAVKGAEVGLWTQDFDAAKALAKEKKLPLLINFTGSDWCYWCKLMDKEVFSKEEWKAYAKEKLVLAFINFPKNSKLVPKEFVKRNRQLQEMFGVEGYPTYILLYTDGETVLGRLGASREITPKKFIKDVESLLSSPPKFGPRM